MFSRDPELGTTAVHLDLYAVSLYKQPATKNPMYWVTGALGALAVTTTVSAVRHCSRETWGAGMNGG